MINEMLELASGPGIRPGSREARQRPLLPLVFALVFIVVPSLVFASQGKNVLIVNSYHKGFEWTDAQVSAAEKVLLERFENIEIYVEYLDTKRYYDEAYFKELRGVFEFKYKHIELDAIITTDDNALHFVMKYHENMFGKAPVSFCGINDYHDSMFEGKEAFTGLIEVLDIGPTIDLILQFHPRTRKVVVVVDGTPTGMALRRDVATIAQQYENLEFEYLKGEELSNDELFEKLRQLSNDSIVLLTAWLRDRNNVYLQPHEGGTLISSTSSVPVYGIVDLYLRHGIVGGKLLNSRTHGKTAAEIALRLLDGESPANIPVLIRSVNPYIFDYQQLERWHLDLSMLPEGSIVVNKPFSVYQEYKALIWATVFTLVVLIVLILFLVSNTFRRKRAEDALREESVFRKTTISESPVGINIYDAKSGKCVATNNSMLEFIGGTEDQVLEQNFYEIHSWKVSGLSEMAQHALKADKNMHDAVKLTTSFGKEVFLDCYFAPFNVGEKRYMMVTATDVSELLKTQKALKTARETLLTVLDSIDATIYVADMETHEVLFMNKHMRDSFGQDFTGRICWEVFRGESGPCPHCTNEQLLDENGDPTGVCVWHDRNPITGKWYINYDRAIEWTDGRMVRIQIATDISDLKKMEAELRQAQKMEAIGTLAGGIAHDFNNVLGIILGNIEMASTDIPEGNPAHTNLGEALKGCFRARDMVRQILAFSRREEVAFQPVDIQPVVKEALKMLRSSIPTTIDIQQDIMTQKAVVMGDPTQIHQILMNLCTNAVDAMEEMGSVLQVGLTSIGLDADSVREIPGLEAGRYVRLTVSDTGHGILPQVLDKIFDPYFTTKEVGKGTGMGLAVAHGIAKEHGGAISVYSEPGKGTTFHVYFPEVRVEENEYRESVEPLPNGTESVLFVDDEISLASLGQRMLESLGYKVDFRTSAIDALESFRANPDKYDLVVTDMTMPNMTGETLAKELMELRPDIPIILSTGFSHRMDEKKAKSMGIKGFITKPLIKSELANAVRKVLDEE